jgi:hypothetical protein
MCIVIDANLFESYNICLVLDVKTAVLFNYFSIEFVLFPSYLLINLFESYSICLVGSMLKLSFWQYVLPFLGHFIRA